MDISTQLDSIREDRLVNSVRASIAEAVWTLSMGKIDIEDELSEIRTAVYGPVIRESVIRSLVKLLNYRRIDGGDIRAGLFNIAVKEYGRDLRDPIIDILEKIDAGTPDYEIDIGTYGYSIVNCIFDAADGSVTPEDPGYGFGGTELIPNVIEDSGTRITVASVSKTGQELKWCMLLYDSNGTYLHDKTVDQGFHQWAPIGSARTGDFTGVGKIRYFIKAEESGLDLDTIEAPYGTEEEELKAGVQLFYPEVN